MRVFEHFEYMLWRGWPVRGLPRLPNRTTIQQTLSPAPKTGPRSSWTRNGSGNFRESSGFLPGKPWPTNRGHGQQWLALAGHDTPWLAMASCGRLWLAMTHVKLELDMAGLGEPWLAKTEVVTTTWPTTFWPPTFLLGMLPGNVLMLPVSSGNASF